VVRAPIRRRVLSQRADLKMTLCRYCQRDLPKPCTNTQDMEDSAIDGDKVCFDKLSERGGGEHGMRYVVLNREALAFRRAQHTSEDAS